MKNAIWIITLACLAAAVKPVASAAAEGDAPVGDEQELKAELRNLEEDIEAAHKTATEAEAALLRTRHRATYQDAAAKKLQQEIAELQKKLHDRRQALAARLKAVPAVQQEERRRKQAFERLRALRKQAETLRREIRSAERRGE